MKAADIRKMTLDELASKLIELKEENMRIRCNSVLQTDSDVHQMKKTRRDISRVKTVIHEKNRVAQTENA